LAQLGVDHGFEVLVAGKPPVAGAGRRGPRGAKAQRPIAGAERISLLWLSGGDPQVAFEPAMEGLPDPARVAASQGLVKRFPNLQRFLIMPPLVHAPAEALWRRLDQGELADWEILPLTAVTRYLSSGWLPKDVVGPRHMSHVTAEVKELVRLRGEHCELVLRCPEVAAWARPGQFVHVLCASAAQVADFEKRKNVALSDGEPWAATGPPNDPPLLRRPISIHRVCHPAWKPQLLSGSAKLPPGFRRLVDRRRWSLVELLFRVVGRGTRLLAERRAGDQIDIIGPLGNGFEIRPELERAVLVAGGIGVAPLLGLAQELRWRGIEVEVVTGVVDPRVLPMTTDSDMERAFAGERVRQLQREFEEMGVNAVTVSEKHDRMLVTEYLRRNRQRLLPPGRDTEIFSAGPRGMLAAVAEWAGDTTPCQVSLEERMGCGVGVCRSCVVKIRAGDDIVHRSVCRDGPVFKAKDVIWT
jgi:dihydroorotate dehydrogenase electron transfer subunit